MTLAELASRLGCRLEGDGSIEVSRIAGLEEAGPGDLSFLSNPRYASKLPRTRASAVIVADGVATAPCAVLRSANPYLSFAEAVVVLTPSRVTPPGVSALAHVDPTAEIGADVHVGPFVAVGARARIGARAVIHAHAVIGDDVSIGADTVIHAHVSVREAVAIGDRVVVQNGAVIGSDGFGFARRADGSHVKVPQVGLVAIEDDVEIGANTTIDRPAFGETRVGAGTKIDNLVQVAHGVTIGRRVLLAAQVGIAGSTVLEDDVTMAGQSGAAGHLHLGRGVTVSAKSAVTKDVPPRAQVAGVPAGDVTRWRQQVVLIRKLGQFRDQVADLARRLAALERKSGQA